MTHRILQQWDASVSAEAGERLDTNYQRRAFLANSLKLATALPLLPLVAGLSACGDSGLTQAASDPWLTISSVQLQLFPDDDNGPSAADIKALNYLQFVLRAADTDTESRDFIHNGVGWLNQYCQSEYKANFSALTLEQQDSSMRGIASSQSGERWLSFLLLYIFEALLSAPAYGGNPNGIGWQWLEYKAGFPLPTKRNLYTELQKR